MSTADNRELFQIYSDRSIRTFNDKLCLGFDLRTKNAILKSCDAYTPFTVITNPNNTLSFTGYEKECLALNTANSISNNFITEFTELVASSEYDKNLYRKENMLSKL